jgi:hypothetical protein
VWSVWSKPVQLYLGQGLAMVQASGQAVVVLRPPVTLPLERVLQQIGEHLPRASRLRVSLSGALCPAFDCVMPQGVRRWNERQAIARSWVAEGMGLAATDLVCELDARSTGIAAALPALTLAELKRWAQARGHRLDSVQPLWVHATQSAAARRVGVRAVLVQEPDATTLLAEPSPGDIQAYSLPGAPDASAGRTRLAQLQTSLGLASEQMVRLGFEGAPRAPMTDGPRAWPAHWYAL